MKKETIHNMYSIFLLTREVLFPNHLSKEVIRILIKRQIFHI